MGSDRVRADRKSSSTLTPGFKTQKSSFLQPRYQDRVEAETDSLTEDKQQNSSEQSNPTPPLLGHSFGQMSVLPMQAKLRIGQPNDKYEQEADRVAAQVVQQVNSPQVQQSGGIQRDAVNPEDDKSLQTKPVISTLQRETMPEEEEEEKKLQTKSLLQRQEIPEEEEEELQMKPVGASIQRQEMPEEEKEEEEKVQIKRSPTTIQREALPEEEEEELQTKSVVQRRAEGSGVASAGMEASVKGARGQGQPLGDEVRGPMEQAFGSDFSGVRVHTDAQSDQLNKSIQARAFTTGQDVFFRQGEYQPENRGGQELLVHELTHVVQQTNSQTNGAQAKANELSEVPQIQRDDNKAIPGVVTNTLFDIWEANVQSAKDMFEASVKPAAPPPAKAIAEAIISIGIDVTAARLLGPLIDAAKTAGKKALLELTQGGIKSGLQTTTKQLKVLGDGKLKISPEKFAAQWQKDQIDGINEGRRALNRALLNAKITKTEVADMSAEVKGQVLSAGTAVQILLQQYTHALYYKANDDWNAEGLLTISLAHGSGMNGNNPDLKDGTPFRASIEIEGLDTKNLMMLSQFFPNGIDPVAANMPFRIHFYTFRATGRETGQMFERTDRSLYFNNGANLAKSDEEAKKMMQKWGGTVPIVKSFGSKQAVTGFSKKVI